MFGRILTSVLSTTSNGGIRTVSSLTQAVKPATCLSPWTGDNNINISRQISISSASWKEQAQPSSSSAEGHNSDSVSSSQPMKEFKDMPGPWTIPVIGLTPLLLRSDPRKSIQLFAELPKKYGKIFRVKILPGMPELVCVFDPEDAKAVFRSEGKYPKRIPLDIWKETRTSQGKPLGLFFLNGEEWHKQRSPISKFMSVPRKVAEYYESFNEVSADLIKSIRRSRTEAGMLVDAPSYLHKWAFESVNMFVLGKRLGCLDEQIPPDCQEFIDQIHKFFNASHKLLFSLPLHKLYATQDYKDLHESFTRIFDIAMSHVQERLDEIEKVEALESGDEDGPPVGVDFLTYMSKADKMPLEMITTNAIDLLAAGVDTTSNTLLWTLYCLAVNPDCQDKLREEVRRVVGSESMVTPAHIQQMTFLRECVKETMRLYAIAINISRILDHDIVLSGYKIPAGVNLMLPIVASGAQPDLFPEPEKFIPERWSRDNKNPPDVFASLPFGFGARMCVGRRVAELELHIALAQLIRTFSVEFKDDKPMDYVQNLFLMPERRFDMVFIDL